MRYDSSLLVIAADFWKRLQVVDALHERDMGALFRLVTKYTGASESGIGMHVGMSQPEVSDIVRGKRRVTHQHVLERIADGMNAPDRARHSLGLAARAYEPVHRAVGEPGAPGAPLAVRPASDQITTATGSGRRTTTELHNALTDYRLIAPLLSAPPTEEPVPLQRLEREVADVWNGYQSSRYALAERRLPRLIANAQDRVQASDGDERLRAYALLALSYQAVAMLLTKVGEAAWACIAADRGLAVAQQSADGIVIGSLLRSMVHSLLSNGQFRSAVQLTQDVAGYLQRCPRSDSPESLSIYGTLFLAGSIAAARSADRATTRAFLAEADEAASHLGADANWMWTAFGPTNVSIHRVATAAELGDIELAIDLGRRICTRALPVERRARHAMEVARAYSSVNQTEEAVLLLLGAERLAPEQVRRHLLSRQLVLRCTRQGERSSPHLAGLARRLKVV